MILERLYDDAIAQASYLVGCEDCGSGIVVDPNRDIARYLDAAQRAKLRIEIVTETHIHADFLSGARELARVTGATLLLSREGSDDWQYRFAGDSNVRLVGHGDAFDVGNVHLDVRHTPGHTPEHICFLVTDRATSDRPVGMFSGDFLFVGDVGRPDLLERAANIKGTMDALARALFRSLRTTRDLPDFLQIWPGHGAGSACGRALGAMPFSTLGYERLANWALQIDDEDQFVRDVLAGQPEPPAYFARMKTLNRDTQPAAPALTELAALDLAELKRAMASGASVIDVRSVADFSSGHIPSTLNFPLGSSFATWAGSLLPYDRDIVLLADDHERIAVARRLLMLVGLDRVVARGGRELRDAWARHEGDLASVDVVDIADLRSQNHRTLIDVRGQSEWDAGHLPGARHVFLADLAELTHEMPRDTPIALYCGAGTRSAIAASLLQAHGFENVANAKGGFDAWEAAGLPIERDDAEL